MSRIIKQMDASFEIFLKEDGLLICFDDETEQVLTWKEIIKNEKSFFCVSQKSPNKFFRDCFDSFDKIAEGLIDAGGEIKKILCEGSIVD